MIWVLLVVAALAAYVLWARPRLEKVSFLKGVYEKLDALYAKWFNKSRTLLTARTQIAAGYFLTGYDVLVPSINALLNSGFDLGDMVPGARWLGPALFLSGHLYSYIRRTHDEHTLANGGLLVVMPSPQAPAAASDEQKEPQNAEASTPVA